MDKIKITVDDNIYEYDKGVTLLEISNQFSPLFKYDILIGQVNGELYELTEKINEDAEVKFFDLSSHIGNKVYERGLIFMLIKAVKDVLNLDVRIAHSIDKGIYCELLDGNITKEDIDRIKSKISEYVSKKIPFERGSYYRDDIIEYYGKINRKDKQEALKYTVKSSIALYKFIDMYDYFYGEMPVDSSCIKYFDIEYIDDKSFVLLLPNIYANNEIKPYEHPTGVFNAFKDFRTWARKQNIENVSDLNKVISSSNIEELIYMNESYQNMKLFDIARSISEKKDIKIILIAGPSSSGKTTTSKKLAAYLKSFGLNPKPISIDDYFVERESTPRDENGNPDFECINAIDINLFNNNLRGLLNNEEVLTPTFNFITGKKEFKNKLKLGENGILIIEGLHALNDVLTSSIDNSNKFKIYISPLTSLNIDNSNRISTSDLRLLRRMVRDNMNRGYNASMTLDKWSSVRAGEEKYVFPFQFNNDVVFNTSLLYEFGVLRTYAEPLLFSVPHDDPNYNEAVRLINLIRNVLPISGVKIPNDSILREFIGDSYFR